MKKVNLTKAQQLAHQDLGLAFWSFCSQKQTLTIDESFQNFFGFEKKNITLNEFLAKLSHEQQAALKSYFSAEHLVKSFFLDFRTIDNRDFRITGHPLLEDDQLCMAGHLQKREIHSFEKDAAIGNNVNYLNAYENFFENYSIVARTDPQGKITYANKKFCDISQYSENELLGKDHRIVNSAYHSKVFFKELWDTIKTGRTWRGAIRNKKKNGDFYWVDTIINPIFDDKGNIQEFMAFRYDISKHMEQRQQLLDAQKTIQKQEKFAQMGEMVANVGHEINNPLAISIGNIENLEKFLIKEKLCNEKILQFINKHRIASKRIKQIVQDLRVLSHDSDSPKELQSASKILHETIDLVEDLYSKKGVNIKRTIDDKDYNTFINPREIQQVLLNLLSNAKDAMENCATKTIHVSLEKKNRFVVIKIKDTGQGIHPEHHERLFEAFFTTKDATRGTGLGLPLVKKIVENHGGTISFTSAPGKGTEFEIRLIEQQKNRCPVTLNKDKQPPQAKPQFIAKGKHILIVEDEDDLRELLSLELEDLGFKVTASNCAQEALKKLKNKNVFDIVIADFKMPSMNGAELVKKMRKELKVYTPVFIMSGGLKQDWHLVNGKSVLPYIQSIIHKPFEQAEIILAFNELFDQKKAS